MCWVYLYKKTRSTFPRVLPRAVLDQNLFDDDSFLYDEAPELLRFRTAAPSIELLTDWYQSRAKDIDDCSRQVLNTCTQTVFFCGIETSLFTQWWFSLSLVDDLDHLASPRR